MRSQMSLLNRETPIIAFGLCERAVENGSVARLDWRSSQEHD
jgi:hypothetical protein